MMVELLRWMEGRLRPAEGWLHLLLLLAVILLLTLAVADVQWAPEASVVYLTGFMGLLLAVVLARRPIGWLLAWLIITGYGLAVTLIRLGRLAPPPVALAGGWTPASEHIRHNWALLVERVGSWLMAAFERGRSEETIVFVLGLALVAWFLAAFAGWAIFRWRRPWAGLAPLALALGINNYYGRAELWSLPVFVGLMVALVAIAGHTNREVEWTRRGIDFSSEIRLDLLFYSGAIALFLLFVATAVPAINLRAISDAILNQPAVEQTEQSLERIFAGVRQPAQGSRAGDGALEGGGSRGSLPRSFLLGAPPELYETVVMTATTQGEMPHTTHWRGLSYDTYTGLGWAVSAESRESLATGGEIPLPSVAAATTVTQTVARADETAVIRYTLGLPLRFDQPVTVYWRGLDDLSRVQGQGGVYVAASRVPGATTAQLRAASLADVPPALMARYTVLPESVPERVYDLAQQVAGEAATPYDQARALESFLRQYPYSLDVDLPPAGQDPVDYFLFEQQAGYCDYYASSMVVMARALGLPARLAAGYLAQPSDDSRQIIRQIDAHSWAEVYFAGYGWLEFEPTAAFPVDSPPALQELSFDETDVLVESAPPPIPEPAGRFGYWWLLALIPLGLGTWWLWRTRRRRGMAPADKAAWAYDRLQRRAGRLGQAVQPSQTPDEFAGAFLAHLDDLDRGRFVRRLNLAQIAPEVSRLTTTFAGRQYARQKPPAEGAVASWRRIRRQLWLLTLIEKLRALWPFKGGPVA